MKLIRLLLVLLIPVSGFSLAPSAPNAKNHSAIIFLPGYLGSGFTDTTTKQHFFVSVATDLTTSGVMSLFQQQLQTPSGPTLAPDSVLTYITVLPGIYRISVYGALIDQLKTIPGTDVFPFAYDWRDEPFKAVLQLDQQVQTLRAEGYTQIDLVAHSLGCLISTYYAAYGTQAPETAQLNWAGAKNLRRLALMGPPWQGSFSIFEDIVRGIDLSILSRLFPPDAVASFPTNYYALPFHSAYLLDWHGQHQAFPVGEGAFWKKWRLGLMARTDLPSAVMDARLAFIEQQLARGQKFMDLVQFAGVSGAVESPPLPFLTVNGHGFQTVDTAYVDTDSGAMNLIFDVDHPEWSGLDSNALFVDGDGQVPMWSAVLPQALTAATQVVSVKVKHADLPNDSGVQSAVLGFLTEP